MAKIKDLAREIVHKAKNFESDRIEGSYLTIDAHCPKCGALHLKEDYRTYHCETLRIPPVQEYCQPSLESGRSQCAAQRSQGRTAERIPQQDR